MISSKKIYDRISLAGDKILSWLHPMAYPGRGGVGLPPVFMIALPKSGSIYIQRTLRRTLRVPVQHVGSRGMSGSSFDRPSLVRFEQGNAVCREHLQPNAFLISMLAAYNVRRIVLHIRDPRAAIVSWTRHMESILERNGLRAVSLACECVVPEAYATWDFNRRLHWQIVNVLPKFVRWIENWLALSEANPEVRFLVTDYAEFASDNRAFIVKLLTFYEIPFQADWISLPVVRVGKNNIRSTPGANIRAQMPGDLCEFADRLTPQALCERFSWEKGSIKELLS
jgi:hypothetical protein